jgi:hypothetical protein
MVVTLSLTLTLLFGWFFGKLSASLSAYKIKVAHYNLVASCVVQPEEKLVHRFEPCVKLVYCPSQEQPLPGVL